MSVVTPSARKKLFRKKKKTKLTEEQVKQIFKLSKRGHLQKNIAKEFRMSAGQISRILSGDSWSHL